jgi:hypothetical protein
LILRFLLFFILAYLVFALLNFFLSWRKRQRSLRRNGPMSGGEEMVLDPQCQSYLPKSEAILRAGHYFCSEQCARLYLAGQSP